MHFPKHMWHLICQRNMEFLIRKIVAVYCLRKDFLSETHHTKINKIPFTFHHLYFCLHELYIRFLPNNMKQLRHAIVGLAFIRSCRLYHDILKAFSKYSAPNRSNQLQKL